jgi:flagellar basal-body rod protein FlgB
MNPTQIGVFDLAERRLAWADKRQAVLAQNVANANTPHYQPRDVKPFAAALSRMTVVEPMRTQPNHIASTSCAASPAEIVKRPRVRSPDGNAVALDEQLVQVANMATTHALVTSIYKKYLGMFGIALGRSPSG